MKYLGSHGGWRELATACLRNAIKTSDIDCIFNDVFSVICALADQDENEVIVELIYADRMKKLYGEKWYRRIEYERTEKTTRNGVRLFEITQRRDDIS